MADLKTLQHPLVPWAQWILRVGRQYDPSLTVTSALRSRKKQEQLYRRYLAGKSQIPAAPPGRSLHELGWAFDLARPGVDPLADPLLQWLGSVWTHYGGVWGGRGDPVHFQAPV